MQFLNKRLFASELVFVSLLVAAAAVGLISIYSACDIGAAYAVHGHFRSQLVALCLGCVGLLVTARLPRDWRFAVFLVIYVLSVLALGGVLLWGEAKGGATRTFSFLGFMVQPAEPARVATLVLLAEYLSWPALSGPSWRRVLVATAIVLVPVSLILVEPSWAMALTLGAAGCSVAIVHWARPWMVRVGAGAIAALLLVYGVWLHQFRTREGLQARVAQWQQAGPGERGYHGRRVITLLTREGQGNDRNVLIVVGAGGALGKGFGKGTMKSLLYVGWKVMHTDFIMSVWAEEFGFAGCLALFLILAGIIALGFEACGRSTETATALAGTGIMVLFAAGVLSSGGMHLRLTPVVGTPMPLVSYGSNSAIWTLVGLGMVCRAFREGTAPLETTTSDDKEPADKNSDGGAASAHSGPPEQLLLKLGI